MLDLVIKSIIAYLLGSISGSLVIGLLRGVDIRTMGSGNAGGTNALRTQGLVFALGVVLIDVGKGMVAAGLLPKIPLGLAGSDPAVAAAACGFAAILGHIYPVYFGFRGGKGAATFVGATGTLLPAAVLPVIGLWLLVIILSGYVGLATILASLAVIPFAWWLAAPAEKVTLLVFATAAAALIVFAHRGNVQRLLQGTENRFDKVRISHWLGRGRH
ncbi:MAG: glycerol-3-phosphate 1-O-acyltransferase PlsY [Xanthomonadales bacterium]|nr:glycerol-3-phosphate 1-O-acyltransferase PlsY [Xanthomonadales bacterium]